MLSSRSGEELSTRKPGQARDPGEGRRVRRAQPPIEARSRPTPGARSRAPAARQVGLVDVAAGDRFERGLDDAQDNVRGLPRASPPLTTAASGRHRRIAAAIAASARSRSTDRCERLLCVGLGRHPGAAGAAVAHDGAVHAPGERGVRRRARQAQGGLDLPGELIPEVQKPAAGRTAGSTAGPRRAPRATSRRVPAGTASSPARRAPSRRRSGVEAQLISPAAPAAGRAVRCAGPPPTLSSSTG